MTQDRNMHLFYPKKENLKPAFPLMWLKYLLLPYKPCACFFFVLSPLLSHLFCSIFCIYFHFRCVHFFSVPHQQSSCIIIHPDAEWLYVYLIIFFPPWPPVESGYRGWYHHLFKLLLCLSCCLRENNGSHQQKELKKVHPEVFLLHSESFSSSACVKSFRSCFSCVIMNMGEKKGARMF